MSFLNKNTPPISVDFGVAALKVLQIVPGNPPSLVGAASIETPINVLNKPQERLTFQAHALPELLKRGEFRGKRAICSVSATQTFVQHLRIQPIPGVTNAHLLGEQIQQYSDREASQYILRHVEVGEINRGGKKMLECLCIGIPRDAVMSHMQVLRNCKLEPVGIHTEHVALVRSLDHIHRRAEDKAMTTMLVDLGYSATKIAVSHGREPIVAKTLLVGGFHFDKAASRAYGCSFKEARERRAVHVAELTNPNREGAKGAGAEVAAQQDAGEAAVAAEAGAATAVADAGESDTATMEDRRQGQSPRNLASLDGQSAPLADPSAMIVDIMDAMADEVLLAVRYHAALFPERRIDRLVFAGGEAVRTDLCALIANRVNLPTQVADPLSVMVRPRGLRSVGVNLDKPAPGWAVPLGLCNAPTDV